METTRYAWSGGSNTAPYDTMAKAATDPQTIANLAVAGDMNRYRGTFTLAAIFQINVNSGSLAAGFIKHIGVNDSDVDDGTRVILDGNLAVTSCIRLGFTNYHYFKNFELKNSTDDGLITSTAHYHILENLYVHDCGDIGINLGSSINTTVLLSRIENNTTEGVLLWSDNTILYSTIKGNNTNGVRTSTASVIAGCVIHDNGTVQVNLQGGWNRILNNVIDGWTGAAVAGIGVNVQSGLMDNIIANRITSNATGINLNAADYANYAYNGFYGNTAKLSVPGGNRLIDIRGNVDMAADGYAGGRGGGVTDNFNLISAAELRNTEIDIDTINKYFITAGLTPEEAGGGLLRHPGMNGGING